MLNTNPQHPNLTTLNSQNPNPVSAVSLLALADLTWDLSGQVFVPAGKWKLTPFAERFYQTVSPHATQFDDVQTCLPKIQALPNGGVVDVIIGGFPVKICQWREKEQDSTANAQDCSLMLWTLSEQLSQSSSCLKMSQVSSIPTMAKTYKQSLKRLPNAGMWDLISAFQPLFRSPPKTPPYILGCRSWRIPTT